MADDRQSLIAQDIAAALTATGAFQRVLAHEEIEGGSTPWAMVWVEGFRNTNQGGRVADPLTETEFRFIITLATELHGNLQAAQERMRALVQTAHNALRTQVDFSTSRGYGLHVQSGQYKPALDMRLLYHELTVTVRYTGAW